MRVANSPYWIYYKNLNIKVQINIRNKPVIMEVKDLITSYKSYTTNNNFDISTLKGQGIYLLDKNFNLTSHGLFKTIPELNVALGFNKNHCNDYYVSRDASTGLFPFSLFKISHLKMEKIKNMRKSPARS